MNPEQSQPAPPAPKKYKKIALVLLITPTAILILGFIFGILAIQTANAPTNGELFAEANPIQQILNVLVFICGGVGLLTWLPGSVIGTILLVRKNSSRP